MTSKAHKFKNVMRVYAAELICSTGVLGFQTFKLAFCIYNRLHSNAFPGSNPLRSSGSVLNVSNGGP